MEHTRKLLEAIGLEGQRLQMLNLSSAMGKKFADDAAALTGQIRRLGPSPLRPSGVPAPGLSEAPGQQEESRS